MSFTHLDLFAGIGGFSRAVHWLGGTTVGFVEWDIWNRRVLAKHWPEAQFHGDIRTLTADTLRSWGIRTHGTASGRSVHDADLGHVDAREAVRAGRHRARSAGEGEPLTLLTGGYPCQPFSLAGQRLGAQDDRHLWPEMRRIIDLTRPRYVLAENVAGHVTMGLDTVLAELEADGYACGAAVVPACAVNALHRRDRVWILATRDGAGNVTVADSEGGEHLPGYGGGTELRERPRLEHCGGSDRQPKREAESGMADAGQGDGGRRAIAAGGHDADRDHAGWQEATGGADERGKGVGDASIVRREPDRAITGSAGTSQREGRLLEPAGTGAGQAPRALDTRPHGVPAGLVRRSPARSAWDDPDVIRAMWADGSWERDLPRVVAEEAERRQKLQSAGNAIVPIVAYEILRVMLGSEADCA